MVLGMASLLANYKPPFSSRCSLSMTENQAEALCVPVSTAKSWQRWGEKGREGKGRGGEGKGKGRGGEGREGKGKLTYLSLEAVDAGANLLTLGIVYRLHICSNNNYS